MDFYVIKDGSFVSTSGDLGEWVDEHLVDGDGVPVDKIFTRSTVSVKAEEGDTFTWVLSDDTLDRDREIIDPKGWDLKAYKANPVVLWGHDWRTPAIGKMMSVKRKGDQLVGKIQFDESGVDPLAAMVAAKVRSGMISTGSVGFMVQKIEYQEDDNEVKAIITKAELFEFSIVNIPSNPSAVVQRDTPNGVQRIVEGMAQTGYVRAEEEPIATTTEYVPTEGAITIDSDPAVGGKHYLSTLLEDDGRETSADTDRETSGALSDLFEGDRKTLEEFLNESE
jgi:HK97 family phage prohead protease